MSKSVSVTKRDLWITESGSVVEAETRPLGCYWEVQVTCSLGHDCVCDGVEQESPGLGKDTSPNLGCVEVQRGLGEVSQPMG